MATFSNNSKNTSSLTNQAFGSTQLDWDDATFTWDGAGSRTWNNPGNSFDNQAKNTSSLSNQTKN